MIDFRTCCHRYILSRHRKSISFRCRLICACPAFPMIPRCQCRIDRHTLSHRVRSGAADTLNTSTFLQRYLIRILRNCGNITCNMVGIRPSFNVAFRIKEHALVSVIVIRRCHFAGTFVRCCNLIKHITHTGISSKTLISACCRVKIFNQWIFSIVIYVLIIPMFHLTI